MSSSYRLPFDEAESVPEGVVDPDRAARERSVDPRYNVAPTDRVPVVRFNPKLVTGRSICCAGV